MTDLRTAHVLAFPPHPDGFYISSALCSCGQFQWDAASADAVQVQADEVWHDWQRHVVAALRATSDSEEALSGLETAYRAGFDDGRAERAAVAVPLDDIDPERLREITEREAYYICGVDQRQLAELRRAGWHVVPIQGRDAKP